ncbi:MAG TPA: hypothetical protein VMR62_13935 [Bryobacteraceae bacterium]|jgi:hypothetical protein|nr:hypothetical protein [Bryobacteraceae bacterium]
MSPWRPTCRRACRPEYWLAVEIDVDSDGIEHAAGLDARSLYEAVGLAIDRIRPCEPVAYDPKGMHEFTVESREAGTQHRLTRHMFDAWPR